MAIGVKRDAGLGVPDPAANREDVHALAYEQGNVGVPEAVKAHPRQLLGKASLFGSPRLLDHKPRKHRSNGVSLGSESAIVAADTHL